MASKIDMDLNALENLIDPDQVTLVRGILGGKSDGMITFREAMMNGDDNRQTELLEKATNVRDILRRTLKDIPDVEKLSADMALPDTNATVVGLDGDELRIDRSEKHVNPSDLMIDLQRGLRREQLLKVSGELNEVQSTMATVLEEADALLERLSVVMRSRGYYRKGPEGDGGDFFEWLERGPQK